MSVDFYECEACGECRHEDYVLTVPTNVDGGDLQICKWCLDKMVKDGEIITYDEDDSEEGNIPVLAHDIVEAIKDYGIYGIYTKQGLENKLEEIQKVINQYEDKKQSIKNLIDLAM